MLWRKYYPWVSFVFLLFLIAALYSLIQNKSSFSLDYQKFWQKQPLPTLAPYPVNQNRFPLPELSATSLIAIDVDSLVPLYEKNARIRLSPASTTKIMTALVALEHYRPEQVITINNPPVEGHKIDLKPGEEITVENLLYGLLVASGNDAAWVLAENFTGGVPGFVWAMNQKALAYGLTDTHFTNPIGLDESDHYSTARDLAMLSIFALKNPLIAKIVAVQEIKITDVSGRLIHSLKNTNELVGRVNGVKGVKTGLTEKAGECLITLTEREKHRIVTVVLGSKDRFGETTTFVEWLFNNFIWETVTPPSRH